MFDVKSGLTLAERQHASAFARSGRPSQPVPPSADFTPDNSGLPDWENLDGSRPAR